jgi:hypothetical protein
MIDVFFFGGFSADIHSNMFFRIFIVVLQSPVIIKLKRLNVNSNPNTTKKKLGVIIWVMKSKCKEKKIGKLNNFYTYLV